MLADIIALVTAGYVEKLMFRFTVIVPRIFMRLYLLHSMYITMGMYMCAVNDKVSISDKKV